MHPSRTVLVLGGSGLIGSAIVRRLLLDGFAVVGVARHVEAVALRLPNAQWRQIDLALMTEARDWTGLLDGIDAVVNAAGALQDGPADNVVALQRDAMMALYRQAGQLPLIQISAAGVASARAPFMATKHQADAALQASALDWTILRPGLVLAPIAYGGSGMLRALAAMPFVLPIAFADRIVRTVAVDDIAAAVSRCLAGPVPSRQIYDLVSEREESFADLLLAMRSWLGLPPAPQLALPPLLVRPLFCLGDIVGLLGWRSPMRSAAFEQLASGVDGDPAPWRAASGQSIEGAGQTLGRMPAGIQERWFARLWLLKPVILATLAGFWLLSGIIGTIRWEAAVAVLTSRGTPPVLAGAAVLCGGLADVLIGLAIAFRRTAHLGLVAAFVVSVAYMAGATVLAPDLWADPLGPMLKVLPAAVLALVGLAVLEDR